jgi:hypothetical protein
MRWVGKLTDRIRFFRKGIRSSTLHIYMKSGNVVVIDGIEQWEFKANASSVTSFKIKWSNLSTRRLLVTTLALDQIEAIVEQF